MSNNEQLFTAIVPTEEANLSGGNGGYSYDSLALGGANASALGGQYNFALTDTQAHTNQYGAVSSSLSVAQTSGSGYHNGCCY